MDTVERTGSMREQSFVSVIVPARNEESTIGACLQALHRQSVGPERLEVIAVVAGEDRTAEIARAAGAAKFGRFELLALASGNKNVALRLGRAHAHGEVVVCVDADTELAPDAVAELLHALRAQPGSVAHGAAVPRIDTWVSRYWELNRKLVKDLHFDGKLSGEVMAFPQAALPSEDLPELFWEGAALKDDLYLGRVLQERGWRIVYAPRARATTLVPWTFHGLVATLRRSRRGAMRVLPLGEATLQAGKSAVLILGLPAFALLVRWSIALAILCGLPLALHVLTLAVRVERLRRRDLGDYRGDLPVYVGIDLLARALKLWAVIERVMGKGLSPTFRGERPAAALDVQPERRGRRD